MRKILIFIGFMLAASSMHASIATATNLVNEGNLAAAIQEINRIPRGQWQPKRQLLLNIIKRWNAGLQPELENLLINSAQQNLTGDQAQDVYQQLLFNVIDHWNPALQPEREQTIRSFARANLRVGYAQEVYQRIAKAIKASAAAPQIPGGRPPSPPPSPKPIPPPQPVPQPQPAPQPQPIPQPQPVAPSPVINQILQDPNIPQDVRKQINQMPADQRAQLENALNTAVNENQWTSSAVVHGLLAGVGVLGLRWLWNWFQNWRAGGAPPGGVVPAPGPQPVPQPGPEFGPGLPSPADLKRCEDELAAEKKAQADCQEELAAAQTARAQCGKELNEVRSQYAIEQKRHRATLAQAEESRKLIIDLRGRMAEMEKEIAGLPAKKPEPISLPSEPGPASRPLPPTPPPMPMFSTTQQWIAWFTPQFNRYHKSVAAGRLNDLIEAITELHVIEHNTQEVLSMVNIIEQNPELRAFLVQEGFYPAKNLSARKEDLATLTLNKLNEYIEHLTRMQNDFEQDVNAVIASEQPITAQMQKLYQDDYAEQQQRVASVSGVLEDVQRDLSPESPTNTKILEELKTKFAARQTQLEKNNGLLNRLGKRVSETGAPEAKGTLRRPQGERGQKEIKEKEEKSQGAIPSALERKLQPKEKKGGEIVMAPSAYRHYITSRKERIVKNDYPIAVKKYKDLIAKQPQTLENLLAADKPLSHLARTMSYPEIIEELNKQPAVLNLLKQEGLYPLDVIEAKGKELVARIIEMITSQINVNKIRKEQDGFMKESNELLASTKPITQDEVFEYTAKDAKVRKAITRLQTLIDKLNESYFSPSTVPGGQELMDKLEGLQESLKKNDAALELMNKRAQYPN